MFGRSIVADDLTVRIPDTAVDEYRLAGKVILMSESRTSGAFSVSSFGLPAGTAYGELVKTLPKMPGYTLEERTPIKLKIASTTGYVSAWAAASP